MSSTTRRRAAIASILQEGVVSSQDELISHLVERGLSVTQPTLSRDLRELGAVKTANGYLVPDTDSGVSPLGFVPAVSREERLAQTIREFVISTGISGTMVVLQTPPADAQPVARAIDKADFPGVVGTLGGDDTIFIATSSTGAAKAFVKMVHSLIAPSPSRPRART